MSPRRAELCASYGRGRPRASGHDASGLLQCHERDRPAQTRFHLRTRLYAQPIAVSLCAACEAHGSFPGDTGRNRTSTCARSARCGSQRRNGWRPASEICGSPNRSGNWRWRLPCIHENALLRFGRLDNGRADDGPRPAGGEEQVCRYGRLETRIRARARTRRRPASFGLLVMHKEKGRVAGPRGSHLPLRSRAMAVANSTRGSARSPRVRRCRCVRLGRLPGCGCRGGVSRGCWRCGCGRCWC